MTTCPFTKLPIQDFTDDGTILHYTIALKTQKYPIALCKNCLEKLDTLFEEHQTVLRGLLLNGQLKIPADAVVHWRQHGESEAPAFYLEDFLAHANYPKSPQEKLEFLFLGLYRRQDWDGDFIRTMNDQDLEICGAYYVENYAEYTFYLEALTQQGLLHKLPLNDGYQLSYAGLNHVIQLQENGSHSNRCFIAMSFTKDDKINQIRQTIKAACIETGFVPILVDEVHFNSDVTINDAMVAEIKRCKFCIADFTQQKDGVYFESGFAAGRGLKVIYTCHSDDRKGRHFDVRAFPFLYYEDMATLKNALVNKINAWIKD